jgi:hypothetical protein
MRICSSIFADMALALATGGKSTSCLVIAGQEEEEGPLGRLVAIGIKSDRYPGAGDQGRGE